MNRIPTIAFACTMIASGAWGTETTEDRSCNTRFAAAARYLKSGSPEWIAMAHHSMDLNRKYPEDWTDEKIQDSRLRHRQDMDAVLAEIKSGEVSIQQVFTDVNACETRLGWPVTTLAVGRVPAD